MTHDRGSRSERGQTNQQRRDSLHERKKELHDLIQESITKGGYDATRRELTCVVDGFLCSINQGDVMIANNQARPYIHPVILHIIC
jgi:hypothetical protein